VQIQLPYLSVKGTFPSSEVPRHKKDWSRQEASGAHAARASPARMRLGQVPALDSDAGAIGMCKQGLACA